MCGCVILHQYCFGPQHTLSSFGAELLPSDWKKSVSTPYVVQMG